MKSFFELYRANVALRGDSPALMDGFGREFTFADVDRESDRLAAYFAAKGIGPEKFVAIRCGRDARAIVAALAAYKAGGAFVLVEDNLPAERAAFILADIRPALVFDVAVDWESAVADNAPPLFPAFDPHAIAFAVYTSGSTGTPKGVLHERGTIDLIIDSLRMDGEYVYPVGGVCCCISPMGTIAEIIMAFMPLAVGAVDLIAPSSVRDAASIERFFAAYNPVFAFVTPSLARTVSHWNPELKTLVLASESAAGVRPPIETVYNFYASSELGIIGLGARLDGTSLRPPVGFPQGRGYSFSLDGDELCFVQPYFRGYFGGERVGGRPFRTGDVAEWDPQRGYTILGRNDEMVKIAGNRVEPSEIIAAAMKTSGIADAAVRVFPGASPCLTLYYVPAAVDGNASATPDFVASFLALPAYMRPRQLVELEKIPRLPNGKVDRTALPEEFELTPMMRNFFAMSDADGRCRETLLFQRCIRGVSPERVAARLARSLAVFVPARMRFVRCRDGTVALHVERNAVSPRPTYQTDEEGLERAKERLLEPFDLFGPRLVRAETIAVGDAVYVVVSACHAVVDGTGLLLFFRMLDDDSPGEDRLLDCLRGASHAADGDAAAEASEADSISRIESLIKTREWRLEDYDGYFDRTFATLDLPRHPPFSGNRASYEVMAISVEVPAFDTSFYLAAAIAATAEANGAAGAAATFVFHNRAMDLRRRSSGVFMSTIPIAGEWHGDLAALERIVANQMREGELRADTPWALEDECKAADGSGERDFLEIIDQRGILPEEEGFELRYADGQDTACSIELSNLPDGKVRADFCFDSGLYTLADCQAFAERFAKICASREA